MFLIFLKILRPTKMLGHYKSCGTGIRTVPTVRTTALTNSLSFCLQNGDTTYALLWPQGLTFTQIESPHVRAKRAPFPREARPLLWKGGSSVFTSISVCLYVGMSVCARSAGRTKWATALKFGMRAHLNIYLKRFSHFFEFRPRLPPGAKKGGEIDPK